MIVYILNWISIVLEKGGNFFEIELRALDFSRMGGRGEIEPERHIHLFSPHCSLSLPL